MRRIQQLEQDREIIIENYMGMAPEALDLLTPDKRYQLYKRLKLRVLASPDDSLEVEGPFP